MQLVNCKVCGACVNKITMGKLKKETICMSYKRRTSVDVVSACNQIMHVHAHLQVHAHKCERAQADSVSVFWCFPPTLLPWPRRDLWQLERAAEACWKASTSFSPCLSVLLVLSCGLCVNSPLSLSPSPPSSPCLTLWSLSISLS